MKRRFVARWPARVRITTSVTSRSFLWRRDARQLISFKTVCYDGSFTFIHNSIFKNTYRCQFIHRDLSFLTLFLFTFSICDGHSKFLFKSIKAFNRSFFCCLSRTSLFIFCVAKKTHPFMARSIGNSHNKIIVEFLQLVQR